MEVVFDTMEFWVPVKIDRTNAEKKHIKIIIRYCLEYCIFLIIHIR